MFKNMNFLRVYFKHVFDILRASPYSGVLINEQAQIKQQALINEQGIKQQ